MTSLKSYLPPNGSSNWHRTNSFSDENATTSIRHAIIREVWLEKKPSPHAVYKIEIMSNSSHWFVFRRYKEFYSLHQKLVKKYAIPKDFLPPKKFTNNMAMDNLEKRREALEHYLQKLINSCDRDVGTCAELLDFLDLKGHDVSLVIASLSSFIAEHGERILRDREQCCFTPVQLYCLTKQLQLPQPSINRGTIDLGQLYDFIGLVESLGITGNTSKATQGKQFEINYSYDLSMFSKLTELQIENCRLTTISGFHVLPQRLKSLTTRYCLHSMKECLIDCAAEKRAAAPTTNNAKDVWRTQAAFKLSNKRIIVQPWVCLTYLNMSHNNILGLDNSLALLPAIKELDLSHNKMAHLDLSLLEDSTLQKLLLVANEIYLISGSTKTLNNLKVLNLRQNRVQSMEGLLCAQGVTALDLSFNLIALMSEVRKLAALGQLITLSVAGNPVAKAKRHRIVVFASFRDRQLELDGRTIGRKEKAKLDAKFNNDDDVDFDDSVSISTVSDDDMDSGIDGHVSSLDPLLEEDDLVAVDKDVNLGSLTLGESDEASRLRATSSLDGNQPGSVNNSPYGSPKAARKKTLSLTQKQTASRVSRDSSLESFGSYQESLAANWKQGLHLRLGRELNVEAESASISPRGLDVTDSSDSSGRPQSVRRRTTEKNISRDSSTERRYSQMKEGTQKDGKKVGGKIPTSKSITSFDELVRKSAKKQKRNKINWWGSNSVNGTVDESKLNRDSASSTARNGDSPILVEGLAGRDKKIIILPEIDEIHVDDVDEDELWNGEEECEAGIECDEISNGDLF